MLYRFGMYQLDTTSRTLEHAGTHVKLEPKAYEVLLYLVQHAGRLVTKAELLEHVWPDVYVAETAIARNVTALRQALGDDPRRPQVIQTQHRQGYRFVAPLTVQEAATANPASSTPLAHPAAPPPSPVAESLLPAVHTLLPADAGTAPDVAVLSAVPLRGSEAGERKLVTALCALPDLPEGRGHDAELHYVLAARVDQVPAPEKQLLHLAAVHGADVSCSLLQALTGLPTAVLESRLEALRAARCLDITQQIPEPSYTFVHALLQDVVYQTLLRATRQQYHLQTAQVLEAQFPTTVAAHPEWLARHYTEAACPAEALPYWAESGGPGHGPGAGASL